MKHDLIHIPFGSGIILPLKQLHAGHYGTPGKFRLHAVLSDGAWDESSLLSLKNYLDKKAVGSKNVNTQAIVDQFELDLKSSDPSVMMNKTKMQSLHTTTCENHLRRFFLAQGFLSLLAEKKVE